MTVSAVLTTSLDLLRRSWAGQLVVLALGAIAFAMLQLGGPLPLRMLLSWVVGTALVAVAAAFADEPLDGTGTQELRERFARAASLVPVALVQSLLSVAPLFALLLVSRVFVSAAPALGLLLVPVALAASVACAGPAMLGIAAAVRGDESYVPRVAWALALEHRWSVPACVLVCGTVAALAAAPLVLTGMVFGMVAGWLGVLGFGLASAATIPFGGALALALWDAAGGEVDVPRAVAATPEAEQAPQEAAAAAASPGWQPGPSWTITLQPGEAWGSWVPSAPGHLSVAANWVDGAPPVVALASEAGEWQQLGAIAAPGGALVGVAVPGATYVQLTSTAAEPQAFAIAVYLAAAQAAA